MEKLTVYQDAIELVKLIYILIRNEAKLARDWSLCDQTKRASISVPANIAEGYMRTKKQFKNYLSIASGSANEVVALLQIINAIYEIDTHELQNKYKVLARQISSLSRRIK